MGRPRNGGHKIEGRAGTGHRRGERSPASGPLVEITGTSPGKNSCLSSACHVSWEEVMKRVPIPRPWSLLH